MNETDAIARLELERQVFRDNMKNCRAALRMIRETVEPMLHQDQCQPRNTWSRRSRPRRQCW